MSIPGKVWFIRAENNAGISQVGERLISLLESFSLSEKVAGCAESQIKVHFGEQGNTGFVQPELIRSLTAFLKQLEITSTISDTNTLYRGRRMKSGEHLALAREHGFTDAAVGGIVEIADEARPDSVKTVAVDGRHIKEAKVMARYTDTELLIAVSHFKGHLITGAGGALKNIGMGCASREGKLAQHCSVAPFVEKRKCIGCEACIAVCPVDAILMNSGKAEVRAEKCIGCASCIAACGSDAMEIDWGSGASELSERMIEYAAAVLGFPGKKIFINVAMHITAECDCIAEDDPLIVPDVGLFISEDPVAIDQASYDLCCRYAGEFDPFRKAHPRRDCSVQLDYAERLHLGNRSYTLIEV